MSYGPKVGISFHEPMSGVLAPNAADPDEGQRLAAGMPTNFSFSVLVDIPRLSEFLAAPEHLAPLTAGRVWFDGVCTKDTPIVTGGTMEMYRDLSPDGLEKDFPFLFSFKGSDGAFTLSLVKSGSNTRPASTSSRASRMSMAGCTSTERRSPRAS